MQKTLEHPELLFRAVFEAANDAILVLDGELNVLACNRRAEELYGWSGAEMVRKNLRDLRAVETRPLLAEQIRRALLAGAGRWETIHERANGTKIDVEVTTRAFCITGSQRFVHIVRDISLQRRAAAVLRDGERRLRLLVTQLPASLWTMDRSLQFTSITGSLAAKLGLEPSKIVGTKLSAYVAPESLADRAHQNALRGVAGSYLTKFHAHWLECHVEPLLDEAGAICGCVGMAVDVSERTAAEENTRFQASLLEQVRHAIVATDCKGRVTYWSKFAETLYFWSAAEALGRDLVELTFPPESRSHAGEIMAAVVAGKAWSGEFRVRRKDEVSFDAHLICSPLLDRAGQPIGIVGVSFDITVEKNAQDELRRSQAQLRALAERVNAVREDEAKRIARELHDVLGQQLTALKMELALLLDPRFSAPTDARQPSAQVMALVERSIETVQKISGKLRHAHLERLGLAAAMQAELDDFRARAGIRGGTARLDETLEVDDGTAVAVFRIFQESLTNIARHAHATAVHVTLGRQNGKLWLEVRDNGRGCSAALRADGGRLGLLGMRERAQALGGRVQVDSQEGAGTRVTVEIPLCHDEKTRVFAR